MIVGWYSMATLTWLSWIYYTVCWNMK